MKATKRRISRDRKRRDSQSVQRLKWQRVVNPYPPFEILSTDQIETIHQASLEVLRDTGIKFLSQRARYVFRIAGAEIDDGRSIVKLDPGLVEELVSYTPDNFTLVARNLNRSIEMGGNNINFATVGGPSFISDLDGGRRNGTLEDLKRFFKIVHQLEIFHLGGASPFEPHELPAETRHLDKYLAAITHHDKIWLSNMLGAYRACDGLRMRAIVHGIDLDQPPDEVLTVGNININSPRQVDESMSDSLIEFATMNQATLVTPFTLLGAMAPTTMAGALVQQNAEALACIALSQAVQKGAPVIYGSFSSNVDMKSGSPAFGTPEYVRTTLASAQLARRYSLPFRASGSNASNAPDEQATYETCMSTWAAVMGHTNLLLHGGGWLEGGLVASFEKLIIDAEILQLLAESLKPIPVDRDTLAVEAIAEVSPGGHFFESSHTMQRYQDIFYSPLLSDWRNFETWYDDGALHAFKRANHIWKTLEKEYETPPLDESVREELEAYVARRKSEIENGDEDRVLFNRCP